MSDDEAPSPDIGASSSRDAVPPLTPMSGRGNSEMSEDAGSEMSDESKSNSDDDLPKKK